MAQINSKAINPERYAQIKREQSALEKQYATHITIHNESLPFSRNYNFITYIITHHAVHSTCRFGRCFFTTQITKCPFVQKVEIKRFFQKLLQNRISTACYLRAVLLFPKTENAMISPAII